MLKHYGQIWWYPQIDFIFAFIVMLQNKCLTLISITGALKLFISLSAYLNETNRPWVRWHGCVHNTE